MSDGDGWGPDGEYPEWVYDPPDYCDRCHEVLPEGTGGLVTVDCGPGAVDEWSFCDDCLDAFTAWRLDPNSPTSPAGTSVDFPTKEGEHDD